MPDFLPHGCIVAAALRAASDHAERGVALSSVRVQHVARWAKGGPLGLGVKGNLLPGRLGPCVLQLFKTRAYGTATVVRDRWAVR